jgi:hypothetical protein
MEAFLRGALERVQGGAHGSCLTGKVQCAGLAVLRRGSLVADSCPTQTLSIEGYKVRVGAALASGGFGYGARLVAVTAFSLPSSRRVC